MRIKNVIYKVFTFEDKYLLILFFLIISTFYIFLLFIILYPPLKSGGEGEYITICMHTSMHTLSHNISYFRNYHSTNSVYWCGQTKQNLPTAMRTLSFTLVSLSASPWSWRTPPAVSMTAVELEREPITTRYACHFRPIVALALYVNLIHELQVPIFSLVSLRSLVGAHADAMAYTWSYLVVDHPAGFLQRGATGHQ